MKHMKRALSVLLLVVLLFSVGTGCQKESTGSATSEPAEQKVKLRISWWGSQQRNEATLKILDMYTAKHPNVTFQPEYTSFAGYFEKLSSEAAANNLPDIIQHDYSYIGQYVDKNLLLPLDDYIADSTLDLKNVSKSVSDAGSINGKMFGLNIAVNSRALIYDAALFKKAGVPLPTNDWTWDDYMNDALQIHEKLGIYGAEAMCGEEYEGFDHYLRQHGKTFYTDNGKSLGYTDDKLFEDFFGMELKLVKAKALPLPAERLEVKGVGDDFIVNGKAAMSGYVKHSNNIDEITNDAKRPLTLVAFPGSKDQTQPGTYINPSQFMTVFKNTKYPKEAVEFLNYFINDVDANKVLAAERGVPVSNTVREALRPQMSEANKVQFDFLDSISTKVSPLPAPAPSGHAEIDTLLKNIEQQVLYEKISLADAAKSFRTQATAILTK